MGCLDSCLVVQLWFSHMWFVAIMFLLLYWQSHSSLGLECCPTNEQLPLLHMNRIGVAMVTVSVVSIYGYAFHLCSSCS